MQSGKGGVTAAHGRVDNKGKGGFSWAQVSPECGSSRRHRGLFFWLGCSASIQPVPWTVGLVSLHSAFSGVPFGISADHLVAGPSAKLFQVILLATSSKVRHCKPTAEGMGSPELDASVLEVPLQHHPQSVDSERSTVSSSGPKKGLSCCRRRRYRSIAWAVL